MGGSYTHPSQREGGKTNKQTMSRQKGLAGRIPLGFVKILFPLLFRDMSLWDGRRSLMREVEQEKVK